MSTSIIFLIGFLLNPLMAEEDRAAAEQGQGIKIAISNASQELSELKERQDVAEQKCSNIPADEPYPDQVRAECAKLKQSLIDRITEAERSLSLLKRMEPLSNKTQKIAGEAQSKLERLEEIESGKTTPKGGEMGERPPSLGKLSQISRKRFEKAFPWIAKKLGHWDEITKLWEKGKTDLDAAKAHTEECGKMQVEAEKTRNSLVRTHGITLPQKAKQAMLLAAKAHYQAQQAVSRYKAAYDNAVTFQEKFAKAVWMNRSSQVYNDPVWEGKLSAIFNKLLTAYERKDSIPRLLLFNACEKGLLFNDPLSGTCKPGHPRYDKQECEKMGDVSSRPCRPINIASAVPGYVYVEKAYLDTNPSDAELAFILAHELAHIDCYHWARQEAIEVKVFAGDLNFSDANSRQLATQAFMARHKIPMEDEADQVAKEYLSKTMPAYAQEGPKRAFESMQRDEKIGAKILEGRIKKDTSLHTDEEREQKLKEIKKKGGYTSDHSDTETRKENLGVK